MIVKMRLTIVIALLFQLINLNAQTTNSKEVIEKSIDDFLKSVSGNTPGAVVAVMQHGDLVFNKAYGLSNIEDSIPLTVDKVFNLTVLSKTFTAYAILELVERNKLDLDDNIAHIFKGFPEYGKNVKIRNLLNHTSGLKEYDPQTIRNNDDILEYLKKQDGLEYESGTKWQYSNSDYALLIKVIEKRSKKTYDKYLGKYIFSKIQMVNTTLSENVNELVNLSDEHFKTDGKYIVGVKRSNVYGEQGIYTNSENFAKWDKLLFNNELYENNFAHQIFKISKLNNGDNIPDAGLGWSILEKNGIPYYWQGGSFGGYTNFIVHFPKTKTTILLLTNRDDSYNLLRLSVMIAKLFDKQLMLRFG